MFDNLSRVASQSPGHFGISRGKLQAHFIQVSSEASGYDPTQDVVSITEGHSTGTVGLFDAAHEYGHSIHQTQLGGILGAGLTPDNCQNHDFPTTTNLGCAWVEGFAHWYAVDLLGSDLGDIQRQFEMGAFAGYPSPNTEGPRREGAVGSFLLDVVDPEGSDFAGFEPASGSGSKMMFQDQKSAPYSYLFSAIRDCRIDGQRVDGVDFLIYCLERNFDKRSYLKCDKYGCHNVEYIEPVVASGTRSKFITVRAGIQAEWEWLPYSGSLYNIVIHDADIRTLWKANLFIEQ